MCNEKENSAPIMCNEIAKICKHSIGKTFTKEDYENVVDCAESALRHVRSLANEVAEADEKTGYDWEYNIRKLVTRYGNKITWLKERINDENRQNYEGIIDGFVTAINDLSEILDCFEFENTK